MRKEAELDDVWREKKNNPDQAWRQQASLRPTGDGTLPPPLFSVRWWWICVGLFLAPGLRASRVLEGHMTTSACRALTSSMHGCDSLRYSESL